MKAAQNTRSSTLRSWDLSVGSVMMRVRPISTGRMICDELVVIPRAQSGEVVGLQENTLRPFACKLHEGITRAQDRAKDIVRRRIG